MISISGVNDDVLIYCLSTDSLPTAATGQTKVPNGAFAYQMDTGVMYIYDKQNDK